MAPIQPTQGPHEPQAPDPRDETGSLRRRRTARLLVPVGVAGMAAATIGLVPALASSASDPDLPDITAEKLLTKLAESDVQTVSGSVRFTTDLGLPGLLGSGSGDMGGSPFGPGAGRGHDGDRRGDDGDKSSAEPQAKLTELLSGTHTVRVAADGPDRQKVSIVEDAAEYSVIHNGDDVWAYDSKSNEVFHTEVDRDRADKAKDKGDHKLPEDFPATPQEAAEQALKALDPTTSVTVDGTSRIAGQDAYDLLIKPEQSGSTIGSIRIAVDADNGAPLKFTLTPKSGGKAVFDIGFTDVSFAKPAAKTFRFTPPKDAKVTEGDRNADAKHEEFEGFGAGGFGAKDLKLIGESWTSVVELNVPSDVFSGDAFKGEKGVPEGFDPGSLLRSFGDEVTGDFGTGNVISTRLVNVLITDDGKVYAGAVTKDELVKAAEK
jgi:outer membrane lipoprotein-sorting protein